MFFDYKNEFNYIRFFFKYFLLLFLIEGEKEVEY